MTYTQVVDKRRYDKARFYPVGGRQYPSVTTILGIIDKSGPLMGWAVKEERKAFEAVIMDLLLGHLTLTKDNLLEALSKAISGKRAAEKKTQEAADIGTAAHALICWKSEEMIGKQAPRPTGIPDAAELAFMSWQDWAKEHDFQPILVEQPVCHKTICYAGTYDYVARVDGMIELGDYKTSKAIYPEYFLQNIAYRKAVFHDPPAALMRKLKHVNELAAMRGRIVRLPKTLDDPQFETMPVPDEDFDFDDFLAALRLWRWKRKMEGLPFGEVP